MPLPDSCVISEPAIQPTLCSRPRSNFLRGFFINLRLSSLPPFLPTFCLGLQRSLPYHVGWNICLLPYLSESQLWPLCYRRCCCFIPHCRGWSVSLRTLCLLLVSETSFSLLHFFLPFLSPVGTSWFGHKMKTISRHYIGILILLGNSFIWKLLINPLLNAECMYLLHIHLEKALCAKSQEIITR